MGRANRVGCLRAGTAEKAQRRADPYLEGRWVWEFEFHTLVYLPCIFSSVNKLGGARNVALLLVGPAERFALR